MPASAHSMAGTGEAWRSNLIRDAAGIQKVSVYYLLHARFQRRAQKISDIVFHNNNACHSAYNNILD